jgi:hypothetical protein
MYFALYFISYNILIVHGSVSYDRIPTYLPTSACPGKRKSPTQPQGYHEGGRRKPNPTHSQHPPLITLLVPQHE